MNNKLKTNESDLLFKAISTLKTEEEFYNFFEDLCTITELKSLSQRFYVAKLLDEGKTYTEAADKTGASTATISRVSKCLAFGADGYKTVLHRLKSDSDEL